MKYFTVIILFIALTATVPAQTQTVVAPTTPTVSTTITIPPIPMKVVPFPGDKFTTELFAPGRNTKKDAPFSAEGISESVQVLEDGNRIRRSVTTKMYRDSEGRFRRETTASTGGSGFGYTMNGGVISTYGFQETISIFDPVAGVSYSLNPTEKTARSFSVQMIPGKGGYTVVGPTSTMTNPALKAQIEAQVVEAKKRREKEKLDKSEVTVQVKPNVVVVPNVSVTGNGVGVGMGVGLGGGGLIYDKGGKTEELGTKMMEGVEVEGTRTVTTIEAGKIGNERDIEVTYERWYSKDLDLVVYSRHYDPRSGEQIYKLVNIDRSEPDRSLFTVPSDYKVDPASKGFTFFTPTPPTVTTPPTTVTTTKQQ
jgi:Rieske Fe-S protein